MIIQLLSYPPLLELHQLLPDEEHDHRAYILPANMTIVLSLIHALNQSLNLVIDGKGWKGREWNEMANGVIVGCL